MKDLSFPLIIQGMYISTRAYILYLILIQEIQDICTAGGISANRDSYMPFLSKIYIPCIIKI